MIPNMTRNMTLNMILKYDSGIFISPARERDSQKRFAKILPMQPRELMATEAAPCAIQMVTAIY